MLAAAAVAWGVVPDTPSEPAFQGGLGLTVADWWLPYTVDAAWEHARLAERSAQRDLVRDLWNPFASGAVDPAWLSWEGGTVLSLARAAYAERSSPGGTLDAARLGILANALSDAGCGDGALLSHLRGPGPHYAGCWAVDPLINRQ